MIGQSVINIKSGGRGRLSTFVAGGFLIVLLFVLGDYVVHIPMAALVAVMIMVSIGTFDWNSVATIHKVPKECICYDRNSSGRSYYSQFRIRCSHWDSN